MSVDIPIRSALFLRQAFPGSCERNSSDALFLELRFQANVQSTTTTLISFFTF